MIKKLATAVAACALAVLPALPAAASNTQSFSVSATVNTIATVSFPSAFTYNFTSSDNTDPALASSDNGSGVIDANLRSTAGSGGAAAIFFTAPANVGGAVAGNSIPIGAFTYTCTGSYVENTGLSGAQTTTSVNTSSAAVASGSNNCVTFTGGHSVASSSISLNLFLDDRFVPADTYSSSGFAVTVSAT